MPLMQTQRTPHNALILIGDGRKALFLRNLGSELDPRLEVERKMRHPDAPTRELGTEHPGRAPLAPGHARGATLETDWHRIEETRFVQHVAQLLSRAAQADPDLRVVVILPPRTLGEFRAATEATLKRHIVAEINEDLTGHTLPDITKKLTATPPGA